MPHNLYGLNVTISDELYRFLSEKLGDLAVATYLLDGYTVEAISPETPDIDYLDVVDGGNIAYTPKNKIPGPDAMVSPWRVKGRVAAAPGKVLRKLLTADAFGVGTFTLRRTTYHGEDCRVPKLTDGVIEQFTTSIQATYKKFECFLVTGEAIRYWYYASNYTATEKTCLHNSCMRRADNWHQTRNYARNPRTVGMLCAVDAKGKLTTRAVVWNSPMGIFLDRVYGSPQNQKAMRKFAEMRGWIVRDGDAATNRGMIANDGRKIDFYAVPLQKWVASDKPYMDTLKPNQMHASGHLSVETSDRYIRDSRRNPLEYAFCSMGSVPRQRASHHPIYMPDKLTQDHLNERVEWISNFDAIPPWPKDLLRSDPSWVVGDVPEKDDENWARLPTRRTTAYVVPRPKPTPHTWNSGLLNDLAAGLTADGLNALNENVAGLAEAFADLARGVPRVGLAAAPVQVFDLHDDAHVNG